MKRTLVFPVAAAAAIALAGCSSSGATHATSPTTSNSSSSSSGAATLAVHNQADVTFATDMIPHHAQAIEMANMAATQATNSTVKSLAAAIKNAQDPEITTMSGWLKASGQPVPSTSMSPGMGGMNMGGTGTGMMSATDMAALGKATGASFDRMWVTMMITHHQGAVAMASDELGAGSNPDAKALAHSIISSQSAQIGQMRTLLTTLPTK